MRFDSNAKRERKEKLYVLIIRGDLRERGAQMRRRKCEVIKIDCKTPEAELEAEIQLKDFGIELKVVV